VEDDSIDMGDESIDMGDDSIDMGDDRIDMGDDSIDDMGDDSIDMGYLITLFVINPPAGHDEAARGERRRGGSVRHGRPHAQLARHGRHGPGAYTRAPFSST